VWYPTRLKKASPNARGDAKPDVNPQAKAVGGTLPRCRGLLGELNLEGLDAAQMDGLGGVTDEILADQMKIIAENEISDSGEDIVGADSQTQSLNALLTAHQHDQNQQTSAYQPPFHG
jgi:hypothetical protein